MRAPALEIANVAGECSAGCRPAAAVRLAAMGVGLSCTVRCILARARQRLLGRDVRSTGVPTASRRIPAQGLVPHDRHLGGGGLHRRANRIVPAKPLRFSDRPGTVGRSLRADGHAAAQFCGLCGRAGRLYGRDYRQRSARCDRRPEWPSLHSRRVSRERDLDRHRIGRHCARRNRFRRCAAAAGGANSQRLRPRSRKG